MNAAPIRWDVKNRKTGKVTSYKTASRASRAVDRIDSDYGACIAHRIPIYAAPSAAQSSLEG